MILQWLTWHLSYEVLLTLEACFFPAFPDRLSWWGFMFWSLEAQIGSFLEALCAGEFTIQQVEKMGVMTNQVLVNNCMVGKIGVLQQQLVGNNWLQGFCLAIKQTKTPGFVNHIFDQSWFSQNWYPRVTNNSCRRIQWFFAYDQLSYRYLGFCRLAGPFGVVFRTSYWGSYHVPI